MLSKLKSFIPNNVDSNTLPIKREDWERVHAQNGQLRSKIDEADHIIQKQKETIMDQDKVNKNITQALVDTRLPIVPIRLRDTFLVELRGLPTDLTPEEANYISGILSSYSLRPQLAMDALHASEPNGIGK